MTATKTGRTFCVLAWTLMVLVPVLLLSALAWPWLDRMGRLDDAIGEGEDQLVRYRRLVATLPDLRAELEQVNKNDAFKAFYFDAATPALAGAELQRKIQDLVTGAEGRLISTQLLPEQKDEHPPRVRIRTQIQGSTDTLLNVLYEIEQARPFLFVDQVSVRSSARPDMPAQALPGRRARRLPVEQGGELTVRLDIFGFALGGES